MNEVRACSKHLLNGRKCTYVPSIWWSPKLKIKNEVALDIIKGKKSYNTIYKSVDE